MTYQSTITPSRLVEADATPAEEIRKELTNAKTEIEALGLVTIVDITSAQLLALNATPVTLMAAPGAGLAIVIDRVEAYKAAGTAYDGIASGEDLTLKYTDASGAVCATIETTGFLDQATAQLRAYRALTTELVPVANAAIVAHLLTGEIATGDSDVSLRITYRVIPTTFAAA